MSQQAEPMQKASYRLLPFKVADKLIDLTA